VKELWEVRIVEMRTIDSGSARSTGNDTCSVICGNWPASFMSKWKVGGGIWSSVTPTRRQFYCDWSQMPSTGTMPETLCPQWNECAEVSLRKGIMFITRCSRS